MELEQFISQLGKYKNAIPRQSLKTIRGQAITGDLQGARKGLRKLLRRLINENHTTT